jgi:hypothetical protein
MARALRRIAKAPIRQRKDQPNVIRPKSNHLQLRGMLVTVSSGHIRCLLSPQLEGDAMPFRSLPAALGILWISVFALPVSASPIPASSAVPQTHAHNDYEHPNPLYDALSWGFISAEADIWLYPDDNDNLRVAHDQVADPTTLPTLQ